jgi:hypothetical protein
MRYRSGRAILAVTFLVFASATLGASCTPPLPITTNGGATQGWWAPGCYDNSNGSESLYFWGTQNTVDNVTFYGNATGCNGDSTGTGTVVHQPTYATAAKECVHALNFTGAGDRPLDLGYLDAPSDAWFCISNPG